MELTEEIKARGVKMAQAIFDRDKACAKALAGADQPDRWGVRAPHGWAWGDGFVDFGSRGQLLPARDKSEYFAWADVCCGGFLTPAGWAASQYLADCMKRKVAP